LNNAFTKIWSHLTYNFEADFARFVREAVTLVLAFVDYILAK